MANSDDEYLQGIFRHLASRKNVLLSGPPGVGKSRLLSKIVAAFTPPAADKNQNQLLDANVAIPRGRPYVESDDPTGGLLAGIRSPKVFWAAFDQNTKHSDFVRGIVPTIGNGMEFSVSKGVLFRAAEWARQDGKASLLVIDEVNRGPAVAIFGNSMVGLEPDKRTGPNDESTASTQPFPILDDDGQLVEYALPPRLYIVAAMNQADSSVEPMDVAFLRRFAPVQITPSVEVAETHFAVSLADEPPAIPTSPADVFLTLVRAWSDINARIRRGRGPAFEIGHGMLMLAETIGETTDEALEQSQEVWELIYAHLQELFFGDVRGFGEALGAGETKPSYGIKEDYFGDQPVVSLELLKAESGIYSLLLGVTTKKKQDAQ